MIETDIEKVAHIAKNITCFSLWITPSNPLFAKPIVDGADIVIHSATKYIGGHNDVLAGFVVAKGQEICEQLAANHNAAGAVLSPLDSWLLIRGLKP